MSYFKTFICNGPFIYVSCLFSSLRRKVCFQKPKYRANIFNCLFSYFTSVSISSPCRKDAVCSFYLYYNITMSGIYTSVFTTKDISSMVPIPYFSFTWFFHRCLLTHPYSKRFFWTRFDNWYFAKHRQVD